VTGAGGVVEEVLVMDMYGRQAARFEGTGTFDVRGLPSGSYIVRIKAVSPTGTKVYYRKLIKK
ncbi:MAG: T9SS type A sorting domain-containing protein, partial [Bacteroidales bacterium]|nr:T9SS type A sorting domain-containing protein [Bacteroidales bacterium]